MTSHGDFAPRRSTPHGQHLPVLMNEVLHVLRPKPGETIFDGTVGWAGHATALLEKAGPTSKLIGADFDPINLEQARLRLEQMGCPFSLHHGNYAGIQQILAQEKLEGIDIVLVDLGMSSMQLDDPQRGFSYVRDGPLDMRMDPTRGQTAAELLASIPEKDLARALAEIGDEPKAHTIASAIVQARTQKPITRTLQLSRIIGQVAGQPVEREQGWKLKAGRGKWQTHPAARSFQALRILVNRELANLEHLLRVLPSVLNPGGRAAIISFHSGEDRRVKHAFKTGKAQGLYSEVAEDPIRAKFAEQRSNPRSRSAKLRWAVRALPT
jgi:16S rRNA (cytosine1402-N4)-methyltransferase